MVYIYSCVLLLANVVFAFGVFASFTYDLYLPACHVQGSYVWKLHSRTLLSPLNRRQRQPAKLWGNATPRCFLILPSFLISPACQPSSDYNLWEVFLLLIAALESSVSLSLLMHKYLIWSQLLKMRRWRNMKGWVLIGARGGLVGAAESRLPSDVCPCVCAGSTEDKSFPDILALCMHSMWL